MTALDASLEAALASARAWVEAALERVLPSAPAAPERLVEALRYSALGGGKRLRPALCLWLAEGLGGTRDDAELPAVALELLHTYSLVHDDLPAMDDDELRRGRPTVHVAFDEATGILVGDGLLTLAFGVLARHPRAADLVDVLARSAGAEGMVGGQALDLAFGRLAAPTADDVRAVHWRKTAALFAAAAEMGAIAAEASATKREASRRFGLALGLAFQATDDVLDVTGTAADLGKTPGKDARLARPSLAGLVGLEAARAEAERLAAEARRAADDLGLSPDSPACALIDHILARRH
ncbi:MAG: polyprenyl synthetase family protein [Planctomycetota bacterium]